MTFLRFMSGPAGRLIRVVVGALLIITGLAVGDAWLALAIFGMLPVATGVFDVCPVAVLRRLPMGGRAFRDATCPR